MAIFEMEKPMKTLFTFAALLMLAACDVPLVPLI